MDGEEVELHRYQMPNGSRLLLYFESEAPDFWKNIDEMNEENFRVEMAIREENEDGHYWFARPTGNTKS